LEIDNFRIGKMARRIKDNRPPCPECGSTHIWDFTVQWKCVDCGKRWVKTYRGRPKKQGNPDQFIPSDGLIDLTVVPGWPWESYHPKDKTE